MSAGTGRAFERWSVERYRAEMGLTPAGSTGHAPASRANQRVQGGALDALTSALAASASKISPAQAPDSAKKRRKVSLVSGQPSEEDIHRACADWVFAHEGRYPVLRWLMHVPNGGLRKRGEAGKLRAMGVRKGVSDWILPFPSPTGRYPGLAIEVKSHRGTVSDEQQEFLDDSAEAGWLTAVVRSSEEFEAVVMRWIANRT
ncbi:VRR-NUC domain-containing protein [Variovorax sp. LjRoot290]|uniref:VRR-NUC domain-containing protein n=1 Tax=unclassified Variovorax TaxID=663243 RepID=UPI003ECC43E1